MSRRATTGDEGWIRTNTAGRFRPSLCRWSYFVSWLPPGCFTRPANQPWVGKHPGSTAIHLSKITRTINKDALSENCRQGVTSIAICQMLRSSDSPVNGNTVKPTGKQQILLFLSFGSVLSGCRFDHHQSIFLLSSTLPIRRSSAVLSSQTAEIALQGSAGCSPDCVSSGTPAYRRH